jgi:hypothetical protein
MISAWESLNLATLELVRSTPIKQRLICAYRRHLDTIPEDQLPAEVRELFAKLMNALRGVQPLRGEDAVAASVRKMSVQEADDCAAQIIDIFGTVQLHSAERDSGVARESSDFAVERESSEFDVPALIASH